MKINYKKSFHYKFCVFTGFLNILVALGFIAFEWHMGLFKPDWGAGAGLAAGAIEVLTLILLSIINVILNIVIYNLDNDEKIEWTQFPNSFLDYIYLYFGMFYVAIRKIHLEENIKKLGLFIVSLPLMFIWTFIGIFLIVSIIKPIVIHCIRV